MSNNQNLVFNSPIEVGFRTLIIMSELKDIPTDIQRLVYFDYFLVHSGDIVGGPESIHPASPFRSGEIAVKREILKQSLQILHKKNLVEVKFDDAGVSYFVTDSGEEFASIQKSNYAELLKERAKWLVAEFGKKSQDELDVYVSNNIQSWNAEFLIK